MNDEPAALTMRGVRKTFEAENAPVRALRGVDLAVASGEFAALMGPSGCGKSTLLNLVAGLDTADEGEISVAGEEVTGRSEDDLARLRRRHIGLVFQFFNLLEGMRPHAAARRRADRGAGLRGRRGGHRAAAAAARRGPDHHPGHARLRRGRGRGAGRADARRPDRAAGSPAGQRRGCRH